MKSKIKQENLRKESEAQKTEVPGHRLYIDLLKVTVKSATSETVTINRDNWKVIVCKAMGKKWSDFDMSQGCSQGYNPKQAITWSKSKTFLNRGSKNTSHHKQSHHRKLRIVFLRKRHLIIRSI